MPIHDTIYIKGAEAFELVNKVDSFYQSAWLKLIIVGGLVIAAIPILLSLIQRIKAKKDIEKFKEEIRRHVMMEVDRKLIDKFSEYDTKIKKDSLSGRAAILHLQSNYYLMLKDPLQAFYDLICAVEFCMDAEEYANAQNEIKSLISNCMPYLSKDEIKNRGIDVANFFDEIAQKDNKGIVANLMMEFMQKYQSMPNTISEKNKPQS